jgi:hypothetical protein
MQILALTEAQGWLQTLQQQWHFTCLRLSGEVMQATKINFLQPILNVMTSSRSLCYLNTSCKAAVTEEEEKDNILEQYAGNAKNYASFTVLLN